MRDIAIFCKSFRDDFVRLGQLLASLRAFNKDAVPFALSLPAGDVDLFRATFPDERLEIYLDHDLTGLEEPAASGWTYQQVVKLCCDRTCIAHSYFVVDSDFYFVRPFTHADFADPHGAPFTILSPHSHTTDYPEMFRDALAWIGGGDARCFDAGAMRVLRSGQRPDLMRGATELQALCHGTDLAAVFGRPSLRYFCQPGPILHSAVLRIIREQPIPSASQAPGAVAELLIRLAPWEINWHSEFLFASDLPIIVQPSLVFAIASQTGYDAVAAAGLTEADFGRRYLAVAMAARHYDRQRLTP